MKRRRKIDDVPLQLCRTQTLPGTPLPVHDHDYDHIDVNVLFYFLSVWPHLTGGDRVTPHTKGFSCG